MSIIVKIPYKSCSIFCLLTSKAHDAVLVVIVVGFFLNIFFFLLVPGRKQPWQMLNRIVQEPGSWTIAGPHWQLVECSTLEFNPSGANSYQNSYPPSTRQEEKGW